MAVLVELAEADRGILRQLTALFEVATTPDDTVAATRLAIAAPRKPTEGSRET